MERFVRLAEVERITSLRSSTIYELIAAGNFPRTVPIAPRARAWVESEIQAWVRARVAARDAKVEEAS